MDFIGKKSIISQCLPPILLEFLQHCKSFNKNVEWGYIPEGWDYPARGWNENSVATTNGRRYHQIKNRIETTRIFGYSHESPSSSPQFDLAYHNLIMVFGYVLARISWKKDHLSMLDWGGGLGQYSLIAKRLMPDLKIDYTCKETSEMCSITKKLHTAGFFSDSADIIFSKKYDFILTSSSLHYEENWKNLICRFAQCINGHGYLLVTYQPFVENSSSFVFIQRPYQYGYQTEYLGWCLNKTEFLNETSKAGLICIQEFIIGYSPSIKGAPEQNQYMGFLFQKGVD
jgi:putative methyltransferase (TIGR04325 family)